ncbi:MAG: SGNH/GDSL hydrolase family protein [Myxococcota bacterium]
MFATTETCADGSYAFAGLTPGAYVVGLHADRRAASKNYAPSVGRALLNGTLRLTTIGDSFPRESASRLFPAVAAELFERAGAEVTNRNIARSGSLAEEWLPGTNAFASLEGVLDETDVLVISLGGNDVLGGLFRPFRDLDDDNSYREYAYTGTEALSDATLLIERALSNVRTIVRAVRERRPGLSIVWVLYPNLLRGKPWRDAVSVGANLLIERLDEVLKDARRSAARDDLLLLDVYELLNAQDDVDALYYDTLHLNDEGHRLAGEELFRTLGGVVVSAEDSRPEYSVGLVRR